MAMNSLQDLYQQRLQLILDAEQQALQAYPKMLEMTTNDRLRRSIEMHMQQTQQQMQQVQRLVQQHASGAQGQRCMSMQALIQEAQQMAPQIADADTRDAFLIGAAQAMEHHEIAAYGTVCAWAREIGRDDDATVLDRILEQEKQTDQMLTQLAEGRVNQQATQSEREVPMRAQSDAGTSSAAGSQATGSSAGASAARRPMGA